MKLTELHYKLAIRRHFLTAYHSNEPARVMDCCQGPGTVWRQLRREFTVESYWGLDIQEAPGRLKIDSVEVLKQPGWSENVVDIDTYGVPWKHWLALLPNVRKSLTVFLTLGIKKTRSHSVVGKDALAAAGLVFPKLKLSPSLQLKVSPLLPEYCLSVAFKHGLKIVEAKEAVTEKQGARYFGVRLEPEHE